MKGFNSYSAQLVETVHTDTSSSLIKPLQHQLSAAIQEVKFYFHARHERHVHATCLLHSFGGSGAVGCFYSTVRNLLCTFGIGDCVSLSGEDMGGDLVRLYTFVFVSSSMADTQCKTC